MIPQIQSNIPLPPASTTRRRWAFSDMAIGDSFFDTAHPKTIMNAAKAWRLRNDPSVRFASRSVTEDGVRGIRVWRVA